jgi:ABC-type transport system involved in Fe-S cluster assembly fused permease/ATPase subunit
VIAKSFVINVEMSLNLTTFTKDKLFEGLEDSNEMFLLFKNTKYVYD